MGHGPTPLKLAEFGAPPFIWTDAPMQMDAWQRGNRIRGVAEKLNGESERLKQEMKG